MSARKAKPTTVTIGTLDFTSGLALAMRFVSNDRMLPSINGVLLTELDGRLHLQATDRYRAVIVRSDATAPRGLRHLITSDEAKRLQRVFTATRRNDPELTIVIDDGQLSVASLPDGAEHLWVTFPAPIPGDTPAFPDVGKLLRNEIQQNPDPTNWHGLNPRFLADFAAFSSGRDPVRVSRRGKITLVEGERAVGIVMGVRLSDDDTSRDWSYVLDAPGDEAEIQPEPVAS